MNLTRFAMPARNLKDCDCENQTKLNSPTAIDNSDMEIFDNPVIIGIMAAVGFLALMTIVVSVWSIRRCYLNKKTRRSWDIPPAVREDDRENKSTKLERTRTFSVTRIDMYGGSLKDLRHDNENREVRMVVKRDLHSAYSHTFLHRGDHNNTIINSLSATWSIQTLPHPRPPGDVVISKTTENPLYATPVIAPKRCASSNALYESADSLLSRGIQFKPFHYYRKNLEPKKESPVYERIIDFQKSPRSNSLGRNTK